MCVSGVVVVSDVPNLTSSGRGGGKSKIPLFDLTDLKFSLDMKLSDCLCMLVLRCDLDGSGYFYLTFPNSLSLSLSLSLCRLDFSRFVHRSKKVSRESGEETAAQHFACKGPKEQKELLEMMNKAGCGGVCCCSVFYSLVVTHTHTRWLTVSC